jgi:LCP family protein required for cell wall assembly
MILHLNTNAASAAVVSIPGNTIVQVPGHPPMRLERVPAVGGPSLLIATVEKLTNVRIDHYAVIDFAHVRSVVDAIGGVDVRLPGPTVSEGIKFHRGINHLNGQAALAYVRQREIPGGEEARVRRQQVLLRAVLIKLAHEQLLTDPLTVNLVLNVVTQSLNVYSDFTNAEIRSLVLRLRGLSPSVATFVTTPVTSAGQHQAQAVVIKTSEAAKLWQAVRTDSVPAFAKQYPATVTSPAPR